jgi:hypothetical protein
MMILRFLNWQGVAGIAASLSLAILLVIQKVETRHWRKQSAAFEQRYNQSQAAFAQTVANYRAAADQARAADLANADRVAADQRAVNERSSDDYETRLADARAAARRLRLGAEAATDPGASGGASLPGLSAAARRPAQAPGHDRLPPSDRLTATEQAIQLDELIKWVRRQHSVDPNADGEARPQAAGGEAAINANAPTRSTGEAPPR